jgi:FixJ family two-component response regulator
VSGVLNKQAGGELGIIEITVKAHRRQVMQSFVIDAMEMLPSGSGFRRLSRRCA